MDRITTLSTIHFLYVVSYLISPKIRGIQLQARTLPMKYIMNYNDHNIKPSANKVKKLLSSA